MKRIAAAVALILGASVCIASPASAEPITFCEARATWGHKLLTVEENERFYETHVANGVEQEAIEHGYTQHHFDVIPSWDINYDAAGQALYADGCVGPARPVNDRPGGAIALSLRNGPTSDTQNTYHASWRGEADVAGDTYGDGSGPGGFGDCAYTWNPDVERMGRSVWYTARTPRTSMTVTLTGDTDGGNWGFPVGPVGAVYTRADGVFTPVVAWGEPDQSCWVGTEPFAFTTVPGQKYWIQVGGWSWWDHGLITTSMT